MWGEETIDWRDMEGLDNEGDAEAQRRRLEEWQEEQRRRELIRWKKRKDARRKRQERARETKEQKRTRLAKDAERRRRRLQQETPQQRLVRLEKRRERYNGYPYHARMMDRSSRLKGRTEREQFHSLFLTAMGRAPGNQMEAVSKFKDWLCRKELTRAEKLIHIKQKRQMRLQGDFLKELFSTEFKDPRERLPLNRLIRTYHRQQHMYFHTGNDKFCFASAKLLPRGLANWWDELQKCRIFTQLTPGIKARANILAKKYHLDQLTDERRPYDTSNKHPWWYSDGQEFWAAFVGFREQLDVVLSQPKYTELKCCGNDFCHYKSTTIIPYQDQAAKFRSAGMLLDTEYACGLTYDI